MNSSRFTALTEKQIYKSENGKEKMLTLHIGTER